ncbi:MAG: cation-translocating P-type ATPase [Clostridiales bacterium]|nr:cation-translocating P-type ATPase [Clostridiales bacterium]
MKYYLESTDRVLDSVKSSPGGLSAQEAKARLEANGRNKLNEGEHATMLERFLLQLKEPMLIILMVAAAVSGLTSLLQGELHLTDTIIILIVVLLNAVLGVYQESKAEKAIEALQKMSAATSNVLRDGHVTSVPSEELVVGDVILLEAGSAIPADCRILESASLQIEEAALTGESVPVEKSSEKILLGNAKDVSLGDRKNMCFMGSIVVYGRGQAVVTDTGMSTQMGMIADTLAKTVEGATPLQIKLGQLSGLLTKMVLGISVFIFLFSLISSGDYSFTHILDVFMIAVSLAVAAIPEGLATVVTIVLSVGVTNMSKRNAIIRKLTAVETLGSTQIICSDKTGTLTQNKMTVVDYAAPDESLLARAMALSSDSEWVDGQAVGEPTENALVNYAATLGMPKTELLRTNQRVGEAPFDSMRKLMTTIIRDESGKLRQYTKGAPDELLRRCDYYWDGTQVLPMTDEHRKKILSDNTAMASRALRVLASAYRDWDKMPADQKPATLERELVFLGLVGMLDPVRPEVLPAIEECKRAGIRPVMITGDHKDTAAAIAMQLGMIKSPDEAITGAQLDEISDEDFKRDVAKYSVYARVQPDHKVRIVTAWEDNGKVTAMTGDGVNDAPSIKKADIGVGMGITGTDVTKNVADMVLADDNFATIVHAVEEGRRIYDNIRKTIQFLLASNLSEVLSIFAATVLGFVILKPVHLLWINLITDVFPALALGFEAPDKGVMNRPPREKNEGVFAGGLGVDALYQGILVSLLTVLSYLIGHYIESGVWEFVNSRDGMTMAFLTMNIAEVFHAYNMRSQRGSVFKLKTHNRFLYLAMIVSLVLTAAVIYIPFLSNAFDLAHINLTEYLIALGLAFSMVPIVECVKFFQRKRSGSKT